jgi:hypothetical protein
VHVGERNVTRSLRKQGERGGEDKDAGLDDEDDLEEP